MVASNALKEELDHQSVLAQHINSKMQMENVKTVVTNVKLALTTQTIVLSVKQTEKTLHIVPVNQDSSKIQRAKHVNLVAQDV